MNLDSEIINISKEGFSNKFKRKFEKTGVIRELRSRQAFIKPSVRRREEIKKAMYVQKMQESEE